MKLINSSPNLAVDSYVEVNKGEKRGQASHYQFVPPATKSNIVFIFAQRSRPIFSAVRHQLQ